jgi:hypothetical protein
MKKFIYSLLLANALGSMANTAYALEEVELPAADVAAPVARIPSEQMPGYALAVARLEVHIKAQDSSLALIAEQVKATFDQTRWEADSEALPGHSPAERQAQRLIQAALLHLDGQMNYKTLTRLSALLMNAKTHPGPSAGYVHPLPEAIKQVLPMIEPTGGCASFAKDQRDAELKASISKTLAAIHAAAPTPDRRPASDVGATRSADPDEIVAGLPSALVPNRLRMDSLKRCFWYLYDKSAAEDSERK